MSPIMTEKQSRVKVSVPGKQENHLDDAVSDDAEGGYAGEQLERHHPQRPHVHRRSRHHLRFFRF